MKLSIIINHHRTPNVLKMCLDSFKKELSDGNFDYEIIVTDSETEESTVAMLEQNYPEIIFIGNEKNIGFSKSVNPAIKKSKGEFIFIINADIVAKNKKSIDDMMHYLEKNPDVGIIGPKLFNIDGSIQDTYFREYTPFIILAKRTSFGKTKLGKKIINKFTYKEIGLPSHPIEVDWLMGSAMMMKRGNFKKIGAEFDDRFFMYFEDADLCKRFKRSDLKVIYFPVATFTHYHIRASYGGKGIFDVFFNWLTRVHIKSYLKYLWKWNIENYFRKN